MLPLPCKRTTQQITRLIKFINGNAEQFTSARRNRVDMYEFVANFAPIAISAADRLSATLNECPVALGFLLQGRRNPFPQNQAEKHYAQHRQHHPSHQHPGRDAGGLHDQQFLAGCQHTQTYQRASESNIRQ